MSTTPDDITSDEASPFGQFLFNQRSGLTHTELSEGLAKVSEAVLAHGGKGTITLKITVQQLGHENRLLVRDTVAVSAPKPVRESSIFFYNKRARGLSRQDPDQKELELHTIPMRPRLGVPIQQAMPALEEAAGE